MTLDPTALPRLRSLLPRIAASTETVNSGIEVPKPTTVRPTTIGEMPEAEGETRSPLDKPGRTDPEADDATGEEEPRKDVRHRHNDRNPITAIQGIAAAIP